MAEKKFFKKLKRIFIPPTPAELVDGMNKRNAYPSGKNIDDIAERIVKNKKITPEEKIDLLCTAYAKYMVHQQESTVNFGVSEIYLEQYTTDPYKETAKTDVGKREWLFNRDLAEDNYLILRSLKDELNQVCKQAEEQGINRKDFINSLDTQAQTIIDISTTLKDDYREKLVAGSYINDEVVTRSITVPPQDELYSQYVPSHNDNAMRRLILERYADKAQAKIDSQKAEEAKQTPEATSAKSHIAAQEIITSTRANEETEALATGAPENEEAPNAPTSPDLTKAPSAQDPCVQ